MSKDSDFTCHGWNTYLREPPGKTEMQKENQSAIPQYDMEAKKDWHNIKLHLQKNHVKYYRSHRFILYESAVTEAGILHSVLGILPGSS